MSAATMVSVEEYLATAYRPDCDYIDGVLQERNLGEKDHSKLQARILFWFYERLKALGVSAFPELRIRVRPDRFRIPDVTVVRLPEPDEQVFTTPPYLCIEVLSPEDTLNRLQTRVDDYLDMGVQNVWILDPGLRRGWTASRSGLIEAVGGVMRTGDGGVEMRIGELFD